MKNKSLQLFRIFIQVIVLIGYGIRLVPAMMGIWGWVLMLALLAAAIGGNFFCGWICPFGAIQEWIGAVSKIFIKKKFRMPAKYQVFFKYSRYLIFGLLILNGTLHILAGFDFTSAINANHTFLAAVSASRWSQINDTVSGSAWCIMILFMVLSACFDRPFCNYFCPNGVKYGLLSFLRVFTIRRNVSTCVNCKRCSKVCPMQINVAQAENLHHANCIHCLKCLSACPKNETLQYGFVRSSFK